MAKYNAIYEGRLPHAIYSKVSNRENVRCQSFTCYLLDLFNRGALKFTKHALICSKNKYFRLRFFHRHNKHGKPVTDSFKSTKLISCFYHIP